MASIGVVCVDGVVPSFGSARMNENEEERYAERAMLRGSVMPKPPSPRGRDACICARSWRGRERMAWRVKLRRDAKSVGKEPRCEGGTGAKKVYDAADAEGGTEEKECCLGVFEWRE